MQGPAGILTISQLKGQILVPYFMDVRNSIFVESKSQKSINSENLVSIVTFSITL